MYAAAELPSSTYSFTCSVRAKTADRGMTGTLYPDLSSKFIKEQFVCYNSRREHFIFLYLHRNFKFFFENFVAKVLIVLR